MTSDRWGPRAGGQDKSATRYPHPVGRKQPKTKHRILRPKHRMTSDRWGPRAGGQDKSATRYRRWFCFVVAQPFPSIPVFCRMLITFRRFLHLSVYQRVVGWYPHPAGLATLGGQRPKMATFGSVQRAAEASVPSRASTALVTKPAPRHA